MAFASIARNDSRVKGTGTVRPIASPFGSLGPALLPSFLLLRQALRDFVLHFIMPLLYGPDGKPISGLDLSSRESTKHKEHKASRIPRQNRLGSFRRIVLGGFSASVAIIGLWAALATLYPRLSVSNESPIDPNDPFSTPFRIANDGYIPLFSAEFLLGVQEIYPKGRAGLKGAPDCSSRFGSPGMSTKVFWPTDVFTYYPGPMVDTVFKPHVAPVEWANICIVVSYRPFDIPIRRERIYRFFTQSGPDNRLHWMQRPASKENSN